MPARSRSSLFGDIDVSVELDVHLGAMTYFVVGGRADTLVRPRSPEALTTLIRRCRDSDVPIRVLGKGANLLIDDIGVGGVVVSLSEPCFRKRLFNKAGSVDSLKVMAGADMANTLMDSVRAGLDGLTAMAGIPATIGGAIRMNAGGRFGCISDALSTVTCVTSGGNTVTYPREEITFGYRESRIAEPIVLSATFSLHGEDPVAIRSKVQDIFAWKTSRQPLADSSAGCAFKNPLDPETGERVSAGQLIDLAELKGLAVGGAMVSDQHANFIVTSADATARHVMHLIEEIRTRVQEHCGVLLQQEVVVWSRDEDVCP